MLLRHKCPSPRSFAPTAPQGERNIQFLPAGQPEERSEDCLYLNVFTPGADGAHRPVLVWIHGGGFTGGSGSSPMYDGSRLVRRGDSVVVTLNYRLGALGFLDLSSVGGSALGASANPGLLDQVAALRWVRDNVERFGGDPGNVTVFGESAGGMSVGTLMGMPAARGLFRRAIPQSGAAHNVHTRDSAEPVMRALLAELEIGADAAARLRDVPVAKLVDAQLRALQKVRSAASAGLAFAPVVDDDTLPRAPIDVIREGGSRDVDVLVGTTRDEWKLFRMMDPSSAKLDVAGAVKRLAARLSGHDAARAAERIFEVYRKSCEERGSAEPVDVFTAIETDRIFRLPAIRLAEAQHSHCESTYAYLFTWESPMAGGQLGSCHALELPFVFGTLDLPGISQFAGAGPEAERLSTRMMDAWLAFARTGNPGHDELPEWTAYETERRATMLLGRDAELVHGPFDEERRVWDELI